MSPLLTPEASQGLPVGPPNSRPLREEPWGQASRKKRAPLKECELCRLSFLAEPRSLPYPKQSKPSRMEKGG